MAPPDEWIARRLNNQTTKRLNIEKQLAMKSSRLAKFASLAAITLFFGSLTSIATAGPGPMLFHPVKSAKEAMSLKAGSEIAVTCGKCHGTAVMTVDQERSYQKGCNCPMCKLSYKTIMPGGGGRGSFGLYYCSEGARNTASLSARK